MSYTKRVFWAGIEQPHRLVQMADAGWSVYGGIADGGDFRSYTDWPSWWTYLRGRLLADKISLLVVEQPDTSPFAWDTSRRSNFRDSLIAVAMVDREGPQSCERIHNSGWSNFALAIGTNSAETIPFYGRVTNSTVVELQDDGPIHPLLLAVDRPLTKMFAAQSCCRRQPL